MVNQISFVVTRRLSLGRCSGVRGDLADDCRPSVPGADTEAARKEAVLQRVALPMARNMPQAWR